MSTDGHTHTQTDRQTDIRTCWAASSQLKTYQQKKAKMHTGVQQKQNNFEYFLTQSFSSSQGHNMVNFLLVCTNFIVPKSFFISSGNLLICVTSKLYYSKIFLFYYTWQIYLGQFANLCDLKVFEYANQEYVLRDVQKPVCIHFFPG